MEVIKDDDDTTTTPKNPFVLPGDFYRASALYIFRMKDTRANGRNADTVLYNGVVVTRNAYDAYMTLLEAYLRKFEIVSTLRETEGVSRETLQKAHHDEDAAYNGLRLFVENYGLQPERVEEEREEEGERMVIEPGVEETGKPNLTNIPCDVVVYMIVNEIIGDSVLSIDASLTFIRGFMETSQSLMQCILSKVGAVIWRIMIEKYYGGFRFNGVDQVGLDFFTAQYLGASPLVDLREIKASETSDTAEVLRYMKERLVHYVNSHRHNDGMRVVACDDYLIFMYMLLWRKDTTWANRMTPIKTNFRCYYDTFKIHRGYADEGRGVKNTKHMGSTTIELLQFFDARDTDLRVILNGGLPYTFKSDVAVTSVIPIVYYDKTTTSYDQFELCLVVNRSRLLHCVVAPLQPIVWTDFGDISETYPWIKYCQGVRNSRNRTINKISYKYTNPKKEPNNYLTAFSCCMEPFVIPHDEMATRGVTVNIIDFRSLVNALRLTNAPPTAKKKKNDADPILIRLSIEIMPATDHVIGCSLAYLDAPIPSKEIVRSFSLRLCSYNADESRLFFTEALLNPDGRTVYDATTWPLDRVDRSLATHFYEYDYRCIIPLFEARSMWLIMPDFTVRWWAVDHSWLATNSPGMSYNKSLSIQSSLLNLELTSTPGRARLTINSRTRQYYFGYPDGGDTTVDQETFSFPLSIADLRGDVVFTTFPNGWTGSGIFLEAIAAKMNLDVDMFKQTVANMIEEKGDSVSRRWTTYKRGVRVLFCSSDPTRPLVAYSTEPYTRDELGYIGEPCCLQCGASSQLVALGHEPACEVRTFCLEGTCYNEFYPNAIHG